jgi:hypothetical protein
MVITRCPSIFYLRWKKGAGKEIDLLVRTNHEEMNLYFVPTGVCSLWKLVLGRTKFHSPPSDIHAEEFSLSKTKRRRRNADVYLNTEYKNGFSVRHYPDRQMKFDTRRRGPASDVHA